MVVAVKVVAPEEDTDLWALGSLNGSGLRIMWDFTGVQAKVLQNV